MHDDHTDKFFEDDDHVKSKTQIKQEMLALQALGAEITKLTPAQQSKIPLDSVLRQAVEQAPKIKSNSAKKRHMQYIGKLIRSADYEAIQTAYEHVMEASHRSAREHHMVERWRDEILETDEAVERFITQFPTCDRQQLRQLVRGARKEQDQGKPPANTRKLFRFLRDTVNSARGS